MAIGENNNPNFNVQSPTSNQALVYDATQQAFVNSNLQSGSGITGAANVGTGGGVFKQLSGSDLQLRSLVAGTNITITQNTDDITISSASSVTGGLNLGGGSGLFVDIDSGNIRLKSVVAGAGITLTNSGTELLVTVDSANVDAGTVGGLSSTVFLQKSDNLAALADKATSRTNLSVYSKAEADAKYQVIAGDVTPDADNTRSIGSNSARYSDIYAVNFHGVVTQAGTVSSIANHGINQLSDVNTAGVATDNVLKWNGSAFVPASANSLISTAGFLQASDNLSDLTNAATARTNLGVLSATELNTNFYKSGKDNTPDTDNTRSLGSNSLRFSDIYAVELHGNATTAGTVGSISNHNLNGLADVDTSGSANGHLLTYNGSHWISSASSSPSSLAGLSDVDIAGITNGQVIKFNSSTNKFEPGDASGSGATTFAGLTDTPTNFSGAANRFVKVNSSGNALEFVAGSFLTDLTGQNTDNLSEGSTNLYFTDARADARIGASSINALSDVDTSGVSTGQALIWNGSAWTPSATGSGDITAVVAGTGLTGGATSGSATLAVNVGTGANQIVQLDGSSRLPAIDGSQLTNLPSGGSTTFVGLTDTPANFTGGANKLVRVNAAGNALEFIANNIPADTDGLSEGSTNQYFTNARAVSALNWGNLNYKTGTSGPTKIHLGKNANETGETGGSTVPDTAILIGEDAGRGHYNTSTNAWDDWAGDKSIAIGHTAGRYNLGQNTIAIGYGAGKGNDAEAGVSGDTLGTDAVAIGYQSQSNGGGNQSVAIGSGSRAETYTVAIGYQAGSQGVDSTNNPGSSSVFVGYKSGTLLTEGSPDNAGNHAVAIGFETLGAGANGNSSGNRGVFLGYRAGKTLGDDSGSNSIAIGYQAADNVGAGIKGFTVLNTSNASFNPTQSNAFYVTDIRNTTGTTFLQYNATSKEITHVAVDTDSIAEGSTNLYYTNARADARIAAAGLTTLSDVDAVVAGDDGKVLYYDHASTSFKWTAAGGGAGDITAVVAGTGLTGGATSGSATLNVDVGTTAGKIVQLDGSARLPAVDGSQLTNLPGGGGSTTFAGLTDTPANFTGQQGKFVKVNSGANALEFVADPGYLTSVPAQSFASLTGKPTTIAGYGITDAFDGAFGSLSGKPTTIAGYGITDSFSNSDFDTRLATKSTTNLAEGTNLYFTNTRADARADLRIAAASLYDLSNVFGSSAPTDGQVLAWDNGNSRWAPSNTGAGDITAVVAGTGLTGGATSGSATLNVDVGTTASKILQLDGSAKIPAVDGSQLTNLSPTQLNASISATEFGYLDGVTSSIQTQIDSKQATITGGASSIASSNLTATRALVSDGSGKVSVSATTSTELGYLSGVSSAIQTQLDAKVGLTSFSVTTGAASGGGTLSYNNGTGAFSFAPADLSGYQTTAGLNGAIDSHLNQSNPTSGYVLSWNGSDYAWVAQSGGGGTPGGSSGQVQFNDSGSFGGDSGFTYNKATDTVTAGAFTTTGSSPSISSASALGISTTGSNSNIELDPHGSGNVIFKGNATKGSGQFKLNCENNSHGITVKGPPHSAGANYTLTLPNTDGNADQVLKTDGSGNLDWVDQSSGGGTFGLAGNTGTHTFNTATETLTFLGTTGQINAGIAANNVTLELDPNINSIQSISFEGTTADTNETKLQAVDPTADRTINLPDASGHLPVFATASPAAITDGTSGQALVTDGNGQLSFTTISGGADLNSLSAGVLDTSADSIAFIDADDSNNSKKETVADFLTAIAGSGITVSGNQLTASGGGGGGTTYEEFKINYATNGQISTISDTSSGISGVSIDSAAGGDITATFTGYTTPPLSIIFYGYGYLSNVYNINTLGSTGTTLRQVPGGGSAGSPTAFGSFSTLKLKVSESETGASRGFGTATHAWVRFVMGA